MSKLDELIQQYCPDGAPQKSIDKICMSLKKETLKQDALVATGEYPVINSGRVYYGYYTKFNNVKNAFTIASRGEYAGYVMYHNQEFFAGGLCYPYRSKNEGYILTKFIFLYLKNEEQKIMNLLVSRGSIPALNKADVDKIMVPIPPIKVQEEIVRILDTFEEYGLILNKELLARQKQYEYYRNSLLNFEDIENHLLKGMLQQYCPNGVEYKKLDNIYDFQYGTGNTIPKSGGNYPVYGSNGVVGTHSKYNSENSPVIGHIGAYAGIVNWGEGKHFVTYNGVICKIKKININVKYAFYLLLVQDFNSKSKNSSQPFISYEILNNTIVPVPPLEIQDKIVRILDQYDSLVNDIKIGLPAEIVARQKQYEYYREKLLTFKELES